MNDTRLTIYMNDHLALLVGEIELVQRCHASNQEGALGLFLQQLLADLTAEQRCLQAMLQQIGGGQSVVKQGLAWLAEKAGRFKLNDALLEYSDLSRLVELETLFVAAHERLAFWESLEAARADDTRFSEVKFIQYKEQAKRHGEVLTTYHRDAAQQALN